MMNAIADVPQPQSRLALLWQVEASFCMRQPLFWLTGVLCLGFALVLSQGLLLSGSDPVAQLSLLLQANHLLILPAMIASLTPLLLLRDESHNTAALIDSTALVVRSRWQIRVLALYLATFGWLSLADIISLISFSLSQQNLPTLLSFTAGYLLQSLAVNSLLWLAVAVLLCALFRNSMVVYVCTLGLMAGDLLLASLSGSPLLAGSRVSNEGLYQALLIFDPLNYTADSHAAALRSQLNIRDHFAFLTALANRTVVVLLSLMLLKLALWRLGQSAAAVRKNQHKNQQQRQHQAQSAAHATRPSAIASTPIALANWPLLTMLGGFVRSDLRLLWQTRLNLILLVLWTALVSNEVLSGLRYAEPLAQLTTPNAHDAVNRVMFDMVPTLGCMLLALCCWQLVSAAQRARFADILASQPWPTGLRWLSQALVALVVAVGLTGLALMACGLALWLLPSLPGVSADAAPKLIPKSAFFEVFWVQSLAFTLWSWLLLAIGQVLRSPLHAAMAFSLALLVKFTPIMAALGVAHPFWNIANLPLQPGDELWQFRVSANMVKHYAQFWWPMTFLVVLLALAHSRRGSRHQPVSGGTSASTTVLRVLGMVSLLTWLGVNHLALSKEKPLLNQQAANQWRAQYEQQYGALATAPSLSISALDAQIDFYPSEQRAQLTLRYQLQNQTQQPITETLIGRYGNYPWPDIAIAADQIDFNPQLQQARYRWPQPVQPGEQRSFVARFSFEQPRWWPAAFPHWVTPEISLLRSVPLIPVVGFQPTWRISDNDTRHQFGLAQLAEAPALDTTPTTNSRNALNERYQWYPITSTLSAPVGYQVLAPGRASAAWQQQGRTFQRFASNRPIRDLATWLCFPQSLATSSPPGSLTVAAANVSGQAGTEQNVQLAQTALQLFVTPAHASTQPSDEPAKQLLLTAMHDTLSWFAANVTPYPAEQLSAVLLPTLGLTGYALPQIVLFDQRLMLNSEPSPEAAFDQRYRRAVHETAHQWFGHDLGNSDSNAERSSFLVESLTKYVELVLIERRYGKAGLKGLIAYEQQRYLASERSDISANTALIYANQSHEQYSAATLSFAILREQLGDEAITQALRTLWQQHRYPNAPAQAMDFVNALNAPLTALQQQLVTLLLATPGGLNQYLETQAAEHLQH